jgi:hypothetical protein
VRLKPGARRVARGLSKFLAQLLDLLVARAIPPETTILRGGRATAVAWLFVQLGVDPDGAGGPCARRRPAPGAVQCVPHGDLAEALIVIDVEGRESPEGAGGARVVLGHLHAVPLEIRRLRLLAALELRPVARRVSLALLQEALRLEELRPVRVGEAARAVLALLLQHLPLVGLEAEARPALEGGAGWALLVLRPRLAVLSFASAARDVGQGTGRRGHGGR